MGALLDSLLGNKTDPEMGLENTPDIVPPDWAADLGITADPVPEGSVPSKAATVKKPAPAVTATVKKRLAAEVEMWVELAAMPIVMRDPQCGGAIHENAAPIAEAVTNILAKHPELAAKFLAGGAVGDWMKLALALQPVGKAVWDHHIVKVDQGETGPGVVPDVDLFPVYRPGE